MIQQRPFAAVHPVHAHTPCRARRRIVRRQRKAQIHRARVRHRSRGVTAGRERLYFRREHYPLLIARRRAGRPGVQLGQPYLDVRRARAGRHYQLHSRIAGRDLRLLVRRHGRRRGYGERDDHHPRGVGRPACGDDYPASVHSRFQSGSVHGYAHGYPGLRTVRRCGRRGERQPVRGGGEGERHVYLPHRVPHRERLRRRRVSALRGRERERVRREGDLRAYHDCWYWRRHYNGAAPTPASAATEAAAPASSTSAAASRRRR